MFRMAQARFSAGRSRFGVQSVSSTRRVRLRSILLSVLCLASTIPNPSHAAPPGNSDAAQPPADDSSKTRTTDKRKKAKRPRGLAFKALRTIIDDATFKDMTLEEFAEWIERTTKANVVVKWKVLEEAGIEPDVKINLKLKEVSLRKLIQLTFAQATQDLEGVELAAKADDNTLIISTRKDLNSEMATRLYDVQALLITVPNFAGKTPGDPSTGRRARLSLGAGSKGEGHDAGTEQIARQLIDVITSTIEPESWTVNGGKGTINYYKGKLVVRNSLEVHQLLGGAGATEVKAPQ